MTGMSTAQVPGRQGREVDGLRLELGQGPAQALEILCGDVYDEVGVTAELGGAVHDARLSADE